MDGQKNYGIFRFVEQGTHCYCSSDCIVGVSLAVWLQKNTQPGKEQIFLWMREVIRQLDQFYRCGEEACYQYVNPFGFIIGKDEKIYLLDKDAKENTKLLKYMQRRTIRERFLPPGNTYYQKADNAVDIHGVGRTFQYILACCDITPALTRRENRKFRKVISKCLFGQSKKSYEDIHEILIRLPKIKKLKQKKMSRLLKYMLGALAAGLFTVIIFRFITGGREAPQESGTGIHTKKTAKFAADTESPKENLNTGKSNSGELEEDTETVLELGFVYFLELEDYEKSRAAFEKAAGHNPMAQKYAELSIWMKRGEEKESPLKLKNLLEDIESQGGEREDQRHDLLLLRGYRLMDMRQVKEAVIRIGEHYLEVKTQAEGIEEREGEVREYLAEAYAEQGDKEEAAGQYESLLTLDGETGKREQVYERLAGLYEEAGQMEEAWSACQRGIKECSESRGLRILYIRMQCKDASISGDICAETIRTYLQEMPDLAEEKEFQKLLQEYGIQLEGEQVWVEK